MCVRACMLLCAAAVLLRCYHRCDLVTSKPISQVRGIVADITPLNRKFRHFMSWKQPTPAQTQSSFLLQALEKEAMCITQMCYCMRISSWSSFVRVLRTCLVLADHGSQIAHNDSPLHSKPLLALAWHIAGIPGRK